MVAGYGYWAKFASAGSVTLTGASGNTPKITEGVNEGWGRIVITDKAGKNYTLYAADSKAELSNYDLPPLPPNNLFDVRYGSGRYVENLGTTQQTIDMQGVEYPVRVKAEGMSIQLQDASGKIVNASLSAGEEITISNSAVSKLVVLSGEITAPVEYALEQNYPNPFNPSTTIKFSVPEATQVTLNIYNVLGEKVAELVNEKLEAGKYSYQWDASQVATGLYIYELRTNNFVSSKKLMLLK
jgi:Secretion system C-terminal sorting domain